ncbi:MAG: hypothetical protein IKC77_07605, partial [Lentisphaeria bacterium]|nr:hypothetical protein [Lentisphaeria bacterium]
MRQLISPSLGATYTFVPQTKLCGNTVPVRKSSQHTSAGRQSRQKEKIPFQKRYLTAPRRTGSRGSKGDWKNPLYTHNFKYKYKYKY